MAPKITPELLRKLAAESKKLRAEYRKRVLRMWAIPAEQRLKVSR